MSNPAVQQIIKDIFATGARFVLNVEGIGLDRPIPDNLLLLARQYKTDIKRELEAQQAAFRAEGIKRMEIAAQGLPVTSNELKEFFADDFVSFGTSEVTQAGIVKAVRWYAFTYKGRAEQSQREEIPAGMVKCSDCLQDRCKWNDRYIRQSSPAWRWCKDYTAKVHDLNEYRKR